MSESPTPSTEPMAAWQLPAGVVTHDAARTVTADPRWKQMRDYAEQWAQRHDEVLTAAGTKTVWRGVPLDQWSRRFEYPFCFGGLQGLAPGSRVLDAGSGFTFFPYLLAEQLDARITCVDLADLSNLFDASPYRDRSVDFATGDLGKLPFEDATFDAVVCVSVLEHMDQPDRVVSEFRRVLKPGGRLVLTMDVSLDGHSQIAVPGALRLADDLSERFEPVAAPPLTTQALDAEGVLTSRTLSPEDRKRLPWRQPRLAGAYNRLRQRSLPIPRTLDLAVYAACYRKP